jgi:uncharacterized protein (DUF2141 family)
MTSYARQVKYALVLLVACSSSAANHAAHGGHRSTDGAIAGLARDTESGDPIGAADIVVRGPTPGATVTGREGLFAFDPLRPGRYTVVGDYAGQTVTINNVDVAAGEPTFVDVLFTLGKPDPITIDFSDPALGEVTHYHSKHGTVIEGSVVEAGSRSRIAGAVVTATSTDTLQTVSDDNGRYRFDNVLPGTYVVSAYYSVSGRAQIEVRRAGIVVNANDGVIVPLAIETTKQ